MTKALTELQVMGYRTCHPKWRHLDILNILSRRNWRNVMCRKDFLTFPCIRSWNLQLREALLILGFAGGASGKEPVCQYRRHKRCKFDPWAGKIPGRRARHSWRILAWRIPPVHRFTRVTWHPRMDYISMEKNWSYQFKQRALLDTVYTSRTNKIYTQSTRLRGM